MLILARLAPSRQPGLLLQAWEHAWVAFGKVIAALLAAAPAAYALPLQDRLFQALAGGEPLPFDGASPAFDQAARLLRRAKGHSPALLCLLSHPPADEGGRRVSLELTRHALRALSRVRPGCRPAIVNAVDPFALDMLKPYERGAYSGFMGSYHLGIDRLFSLRDAVGRFLLPYSSWRDAPFRIARGLSGGAELAMVLAGGVPETGRILYGVREFMHRLREERPEPRIEPRQALESLCRASPGFVRFKGSGRVGDALHRSAWRAMEAWVVSCLVDGEEDVRQGRLPREAADSIRRCARALGWSEGDIDWAMKDLAEEFAAETPRRERFFRFLGARVVARGTPVLILPLTHGRSAAARLGFGEPALLSAASRRTVTVLSIKGREAELGVRELARSFVRSRFS